MKINQWTLGLALTGALALATPTMAQTSTITNLIPLTITNSVTKQVVNYTNVEVITVTENPLGATVAGDTNAPTVQYGLNFILNTLTGNSTNWYGVAYGLYAPGLKNKAGGGFGIFTPILSQYTVFGVRVDYVDGGFWMPQGTFTLQYPTHPLSWLNTSFGTNFTATPFAYAGIGLPLSGAKIVTTYGNINVPGKITDNNGDATAITGFGLAVSLWHRSTPATHWYQPVSLAAIGDVEQWSGFSGNQYRFGLESHFNW